MLETKNITKRFPGVLALENVSLQIEAGKVTAIIGGNGAGKSTLMKILSGIYTDYEGQIIYKQKPVHFSGTAAAQEVGIAIIHQELHLIPYLSIADNIFLGRELLNRFGLLDKKSMYNRTREILQNLGLALEPDQQVSDLKVGQQQMVEIAKALLFDADLIIMDEPTSAITTAEIETLFTVIRKLRNEQKAIIYISHKLDELFSIADYYFVLRDGRNITSGNMQNSTPDELIRNMAGAGLKPLQKETGLKEAVELLQVEDLCLETKNKSISLKRISFTVNRGEILGIFGLMGAGRTELLETLFGLYPGIYKGKIFIQKQLIRLKNPADAVNAGMVLLPEDRKKDGLVLGMEVQQNISLPGLEFITTLGFLSKKKETKLAEKYIGQLHIKTPSVQQLTKNLSGGNQQKIVLAKWLEKNPALLLLDEPTRGIDVKAKNEIYQIMEELAGKGMGIIMVSSELSEIVTVANRVLVMANGTITANLPVADASEDKLLKAAIASN